MGTSLLFNEFKEVGLIEYDRREIKIFDIKNLVEEEKKLR
jgi:hypothetical protein